MKIIKKSVALLVALVLMISSFQIVIVAAEGTGTVITVDNVYGSQGGTVSVNVTIKNNPGILGAILSFSYDEGLTLVNAVSGEAFSPLIMSKPGIYTSPAQFAWDGEKLKDGDIKDGIILTLTFEISEKATLNDYLDINISYDKGNVIDANLKPVVLETVSGTVEVIDYTPGDLDDDGKVTVRDVVLLRRHITGGYDITINEYAADVNDDGVINTTDVILIRRYIAGGYGVILLPSHGICNHELTFVEAKEPTCTKTGNNEYWYCPTCDKYFGDSAGTLVHTLEDTVIPANGHTEVVIPDVAPDYENSGTVGGKKCIVCGVITEESKLVPPLEKDEYFVEYNLAGTDTYLANYLTTVDISTINPNPNLFNTTEKGYTLEPIDKDIIPGYEFQGWVDGYGETVKSIEKGAVGSTKLYAQWYKTEYNIIFDSPLYPIETQTRTIDEVYYLPEDMEWDHYVFMGWSDASGKIIKQVKPGTKDITVHANWTSNRSQARANDYLADGPIIFEDEKTNKYYFVYDLGMIINVPLETIVDLGYRSSLEIEETVTKTVTLGQTEATALNTAVENATTKSSSWTLSQDWNELLTDITGGEEAVTSNQTIALSTGTSKAYSSSGSTYVGESFHASKDNFTTAKTVTDDSWKVGAEAGVEASYGPVKASVSVSGEVAHSENQEDYSEQKTNMTLDSSWNTSNSYSSSGSYNSTNSISNSIMKAAKDTWQHEISKSIGGSDTETTSDSVSNKESSAYSSSMSFHSVEEKETVEKISSGANTTPGYYRYVLAGDFYVYAIVSYDLATGTYAVTNHSVLADQTRRLLDYSKNDPLYQDYNNAVLPFEVPIDVHNYVFDSLSETDGLIIDRESGIVSDYEGDAKNVFIPDYAIFDNGDGSEATVVKVTGFAANAFKGKDIENIKLGKFITEIPVGYDSDGNPYGAFEDCTSLKSVKYNVLTSIGEKAFKGCNALENFIVSDSVSVLGENAFDGVNSVSVNAASPEVAVAAVTSTAKNMVLNLNSLNGDLSDTLLDVKVTDSFTLNGYGATYDNLGIKSSSDITAISRITFTNNTKVPLHLNSEKIILNQVKVENASVIVLISEADSTVVSLQGKNNFATSSENVILTKDITIERKDGITETSELNANDKKILVCGAVTDEKGYLKVVSSEQIIYISVDDYGKMLNSHYIIFDANGGEVDTEKKLIMYASKLGELPVPTREGCTFNGWFTEDGTQITENTEFTYITDITVKAHWQSDWVLASELPSDGTINSTKWTYDLTTRTTSDSSTAPEGYTEYQDPTWVWGSYGSWSSWSKTKVTASDSRKVETKTVTDRAAYTNYKYYIYRTSDGWGFGTKNYVTSHGACTKYDEINLTYKLSAITTGDYAGLGLYGKYDSSMFSHSGDSYWFYSGSNHVAAVTHTEYRYADRSKVYTYYYQKIESKESSTEISASDTISNVKKWVKYTVQ